MEFSRRVGSFFGLELRVELQKSSRFSAMPSELDIAKRGLVKVVKEREGERERERKKKKKNLEQPASSSCLGETPRNPTSA